MDLQLETKMGFVKKLVEFGAILILFCLTIPKNASAFGVELNGKTKFEGIRGRPAPGSFSFHPNADTTKELKVLLSNPPGRIKICYDNTSGTLYGYNSCS